MKEVAVVGVGKTRFGALADRDLRSLAVESVQNALADAALPAAAIQAFYLGNFAGPSFTGQSHLAPYVAAAAGLTGIPATRYEAACASSGAAFHAAWQAVAHGIYETVVVCGVEKMTSQPTARVAQILAMAGDVAGEGIPGATFPAIFAMIARRHMHQYGTTREQLAAVAVKNHAYGFTNPYAHLRKIITIEQALAGKPIAEPLTLYDCSLVSDGAAAVVLRAGAGGVPVLACAQTSDHVDLRGKADITRLPAVAAAAQAAYRMAKLTARDIDFAEVHDCFTIAEILAVEELGFCAKGEGGPWSQSAPIPINRSGGLKSKGHPVGATGVAQIADVALQIRGRADGWQVEKADIGLAQNLGGSGATSVVTILGKERMQ
ncbi:MAG TPA: thiolase domain-containing protein [Bryobacteraceae bacterium]|nr:thiolase domain-containing protein [Bryobacteraceae bacterium]